MKSNLAILNELSFDVIEKLICDNIIDIKKNNTNANASELGSNRKNCKKKPNV